MLILITHDSPYWTASGADPRTLSWKLASFLLADILNSSPDHRKALLLWPVLPLPEPLKALLPEGSSLRPNPNLLILG